MKLLTVMAWALLLFACRKDEKPTPGQPAPIGKKVLLKDIKIKSLPSPFYHFEYNDSGKVAKVSHASGLTMYNVERSGTDIAVMKNNTAANKDQLQYIYDGAGKLLLVTFTNLAKVYYKRCVFEYESDQLKNLKWERKQGDQFLLERSITFTYFPDGNVNLVNDFRPTQPGAQQGILKITRFEVYDDAVNVDDFSLAHDPQDHLVLLPAGIRLQKNNPRWEKMTISGREFTVTYQYTYNEDNAPLTKSGQVTVREKTGVMSSFDRYIAYSYY